MQVDKLRNRTRLVSFRVSPGEYEILLQTCRASDSRNISEFARSATMRVSSIGGSPDQADQVAGLSETIRLLLRKLEQLESRIGEVQGALKRLREPLSRESDQEEV